MSPDTREQLTTRMLDFLTEAARSGRPVAATDLHRELYAAEEYVRAVRLRLEREGRITTWRAAPPPGTDYPPHPRMWVALSGAPRPVRWTPEDLDRCEHGRHSIDSCFDCPSGQSTGNVFLLNVLEGRREHRATGERIEVRIGTAVHGEPIWAVVRDNPREAS